MSEVRDFITQTEIPFLSVIERNLWGKHLNQIKFDLEQLVMLSDRFYKKMNDESEGIINSISDIFERDSIEELQENVTEQLYDIVTKYSDYRAEIINLLKNYFSNRDKMLKDIDNDHSNSQILMNWMSRSHLNEDQMIKVGDKVKNDLRMMLNVIDIYDFKFGDEIAEHFRQILTMAMKSSREKSFLIEGNEQHEFSQIIFSIREAVLLAADETNYNETAHSESDRSLIRRSSLEHQSSFEDFNKEEKLEHERLDILKRRAQEMAKINEEISILREKLKPTYQHENN